MITEQYTDLAGFIRIVWQMETTGYTDKVLTFKFKTQPTTEQLETLEANWIDAHEYDNLISLEYNLFDYIDLLKEVVQGIEDNPTMTLTQFNNYIGQKAWWQQATIEFFMVVTATKLAEHYDITLSDYNNQTVFENVRDWIAATPSKKIAKVLFNE